MLKQKNSILRIVGTNIVSLTLGMVAGGLLSLMWCLIILLALAVGWLMIYDENAYTLRYKQGGRYYGTKI